MEIISFYFWYKMIAFFHQQKSLSTNNAFNSDIHTFHRPCLFPPQVVHYTSNNCYFCFPFVRTHLCVKLKKHLAENAAGVQDSGSTSESANFPRRRGQKCARISRGGIGFAHRRLVARVAAVETPKFVQVHNNHVASTAARLPL